MTQPDVLFIMTDQQRFDTIAALGNTRVHTPNMDRLVRQGVSFTNAYSPCPVCIPARYTIRSGCEPTRTGVYSNHTTPDVHADVESRCGPWLAQLMSKAGYRTWGVGKFHTVPWDAPLGYEDQYYSEELYTDLDQRTHDSYAGWIAREHPDFAWIEGLMGERTDMYYVPQVSPLPAELTVEWWAADRAVEQIATSDRRPTFGFLSFVGPHPPFAPPVPFNRLYDPDTMPDPVGGGLSVDHMDEQIPYMNHLVFAEDISPAQARQLKARYYGEISYIDHCIGRVLDAVEARHASRETVIAFFADHGDHLGDHHGWQKESFFEASTRIPLVVCWPSRLAGGSTCDGLASLTDLFGLAMTAAGTPERRDGFDLVAMARGQAGRSELFGFWGMPGSNSFKIMLRRDQWKLIWMANGGQTQLFDVGSDPDEVQELTAEHPGLVDDLLAVCGRRLMEDGLSGAVLDGRPRALPHRSWPRERIYQFDASRGVYGFPQTIEQGLADYAEERRQQTGSVPLGLDRLLRGPDTDADTGAGGPV